MIALSAIEWAFDFIMYGIQKNSKHEIVIMHPNSVKKEDVDNADVFFSNNPQCWVIMDKNLRTRALENKKVICSLGSKWNVRESTEIIKDNKFRYVRVASNDIKRYADSITNIPNLIVVENAVDTDLFRPLNIPREEFTIGWAGNYPRQEKRTHLLENFKYNLSLARQGPRKLGYSEMVDFYNGLDVYLCVSSTESTPMPVLEAMACGLPVISTEVGLVPELLEKRWVVPTTPEEKVVSLIKPKLDALARDKDLRKEVGNRNLNEILNNWSCKARIKYWDQMFEM